MAESTESDESLVPRRWAHATVSASMHCRNCGYDLRGLDASGRCSECGLDVWATVVHSVDPASSRLPSLRNPVAVGNALVVLALCMFLGTLLMVMPAVSAAIDGAMSSGTGARALRWWHRLPMLDWRYGMLLMAGGLWAIWTLAPPRGSEPHGAVWDDIWRLTVGYAGWISCATMLQRLNEMPAAAQHTPVVVLALAAGGFAIICLVGLRGVFAVIGFRSREYRRMQGGRQSVGLILLAVAAALAGRALADMAGFDGFPRRIRFGVQTVGQVVAAASMFMVLIGLAYVVGNAWAIRRALRRPPPALDQVLLPHMPNDTWVPERED